MIAIYLLTNTITGQQYVGITKDKARRFSTHRLAKRKTKLHRAITKYGWSNFDVSILDEVETWNEAHDREKLFIEAYQTFYNGYNHTLGGEGSAGHTPWNKGLTKETSEIVRKIGEKQKGKNKNSGRVWSRGEREEASRVHKGKPKTTEHKIKLSSALKGRPLSEETKQKMSQSRKGKPTKEFLCPFCQKSGKSSAMFRWHFDNCEQAK